MRTFLIDYDLNVPGKDYTSLIAYIRTFPNWCHYLKSGWMVQAESTAAQVRDGLLQHIDATDDVLVIDVTGAGAAWYGLSAEISNWIQANV